MILSSATPFNEKMREQLVKIWKGKRKKTCEQFFNISNRWYENKEKNTNMFSYKKNTQL